MDYVNYKKMIHDDCLVGLETMTLIVINMMNIIHGIIMYGLKVKFYKYYKVIFWQTLSFVQVLTLRRNEHFKEKKSSSWFLPHKKLWLGHPFCKHCHIVKSTNGPRVDWFCHLLNRWPIWKQLLLASLAQLETFGTSGLDYVNFLLDGQTNRQGHLYLHHPESNRSSLNGLTRVWHKLQHKQTK